MIKLKNLWKIALATMAMSAMLVACDTTSDDKDNNEDEGGATAGFYISGLNGNDWAGDTDVATAHAMTKGEGEVYTFTFTAESTNPFPYGLKFTTENGWMEQYQAYNKEAPTTDFAILEAGKEVSVYYATKAELEAADEDGNKIADSATKFKVKSTSLFKVGNEYTITFDKVNMKTKIAGEFEAVSVQNITVTINIGDAKLTLTNVPTYNADDVATIDGSLFSWCEGSAQTLKATDCEVTADWSGAEKNTWVAEQQPTDVVTGADAWAKLTFSADGSEGWVPYSTTGEFTYSWADKK